jgi:hypothetical protein
MISKKILALGVAGALLLTGTSAYAAKSPEQQQAKQEAKAEKQKTRELHQVQITAKLQAAAKKLGLDPTGKTNAQLKEEIKAKVADKKKLAQEHRAAVLAKLTDKAKALGVDTTGKTAKELRVAIAEKHKAQIKQKLDAKALKKAERAKKKAEQTQPAAGSNQPQA